jgi:hypothetical protein
LCNIVVSAVLQSLLLPSSYLSYYRRLIGKICIAYSGILVLTVHGIDCFRELSVVNAASVDPNIIESVGCSHVAGVSDLFIFYLFFCIVTFNILKGNFTFTLCM